MDYKHFNMVCYTVTDVTRVFDDYIIRAGARASFLSLFRWLWEASKKQEGE